MNEGGVTPLYNAVITGNLRMAEILLKAGADPNLGDIYGYMYAFTGCSHESGYFKTIVCLWCADPEIYNPYRGTPLHVRCSEIPNRRC